MGTCIFCYDNLNKGIQNHMIHTHKLSKLEFDFLFISNENLAQSLFSSFCVKEKMQESQ